MQCLLIEPPQKQRGFQSFMVSKTQRTTLLLRVLMKKKFILRTESVNALLLCHFARQWTISSVIILFLDAHTPFTFLLQGSDRESMPRKKRGPKASKKAKDPFQANGDTVQTILHINHEAQSLPASKDSYTYQDQGWCKVAFPTPFTNAEELAGTRHAILRYAMKFCLKYNRVEIERFFFFVF